MQHHYIVCRTPVVLYARGINIQQFTLRNEKTGKVGYLGCNYVVVREKYGRLKEFGKKIKKTISDFFFFFFNWGRVYYFI